MPTMRFHLFARIVTKIGIGIAIATSFAFADSERPYPETATYIERIQTLSTAAGQAKLKDFLQDQNQPLADRLNAHLVARHLGLNSAVALLPELSDCSGVESFFVGEGPQSRESIAAGDFASDTCLKAYLGSIQNLWAEALKDIQTTGGPFSEKQRQIHAVGFITRMNLYGLLRAKRMGSRKQDLVKLGLMNLESFLEQGNAAAKKQKLRFMDLATGVRKKKDSTANQAGTPDYDEMVSLENARFLADIAATSMGNLLNIAKAPNALDVAVSDLIVTRGPGFELSGSPVTGAVRAKMTESMTSDVAFTRIADFMRGADSDANPSAMAVFRGLYGSELKSGTVVLVNLALPEFFQSHLNQPLLKPDFNSNTAAGAEIFANCYSTARKYAFGDEFPHVDMAPGEIKNFLSERFEKIETATDATLLPGDILTYWGYQPEPESIPESEMGDDGVSGGRRGSRLLGDGVKVRFEVLHAATYLGSGLTFSKADVTFASDHRVKALAEEVLNPTYKSRQVWRRRK